MSSAVAPAPATRARSSAHVRIERILPGTTSHNPVRISETWCSYSLSLNRRRYVTYRMRFPHVSLSSFPSATTSYSTLSHPTVVNLRFPNSLLKMSAASASRSSSFVSSPPRVVVSTAKSRTAAMWRQTTSSTSATSSSSTSSRTRPFQTMGERLMLRRLHDRIPMPIRRPTNRNIDRCDGVFAALLGTCHGVRSLPILRRELGVSTNKGNSGDISSRLRDSILSLYGPPWSIEPMPMKFARQARRPGLRRNSFGSRVFSCW
mmetsp:Transcript_5798/g.10949  ORF Transcript_5798/g.10949 Transcript_5798/m.10949 type:complete len:262 (+) Transcript_5798:799-1584(+)